MSKRVDEHRSDRPSKGASKSEELTSGEVEKRKVQLERLRQHARVLWYLEDHPQISTEPIRGLIMLQLQEAQIDVSQWMSPENIAVLIQEESEKIKGLADDAIIQGQLRQAEDLRQRIEGYVKTIATMLSIRNTNRDLPPQPDKDKTSNR